MGGAGTRTVFLVSQGVWEMPLESMPLASAYLKAAAYDHPDIRDGFDIQLHNFRGGATHVEMARDLFGTVVPDILAFSVFGWNQRAFGSLAATFGHLNPAGWVIFGGTHVTNQAERVFRLFPDVDIVVNGEGELTFTELLRALTDPAGPDLTGVAGISWRGPDGTVVTNPPRPRIEHLDVIPSPFLSGAVDLTDESGAFRYDVALFETNRGCPYKCSFCYWGGAVGQRVRAFSRDRLRAELELFASLGVHTVVACDANFGMLPADLDLVDDLIDIKARYGYPRAFETSWAKNKSRTFYEIVRRMKRAGLRSSFTLALQTLDADALDAMNRRNMRVNDWRDLVTWLTREGLDCYAELIWGAPGETVESFLAGYDRLARDVSRIAVYPLMLLPNTDYLDHRDEHGFVSVRGDRDDFEYVLAHRTMTFADDARMQRFLFYSRVLAENAVLRHVWVAMRELAGLDQSRVITTLADWVDRTDEPSAAPLRAAAARAHGGGAPAYATAIAYLFTDPDGERALTAWWTEAIRPLVPAKAQPLVDDIFRYDLLTQPVCPPPGAPPPLPVVTVDGQEYYLRANVAFDHDVPRALADLRAGRPPQLDQRPSTLDLYYRTGARNAVLSTNHEEIVHYLGAPAAAIGAL